MIKLASLSAAALIAIALSTAGPAAADSVVNDDAAGNLAEIAPCDVAPDFTVVQDAIDDAVAGDTITVCPGTYQEDLTVFTDNITLLGVDRATTVIEGIATDDAGDFPLASPNIDLQANGVTLESLTIMSPSAVDGRYSSGLVIDGVNNRIRNNSFLVAHGLPGSVAIQTWALENGSVGDVSGLQIKRNSFESQGDVATDVFGYEGVFINPQFLATDPENNVGIKRNTFAGALYRAIGIDRVDVVAHKNTITTELPISDQPTFGGDVPLGIKLFSGNHHSIKKNHMEGVGDGMIAAGLTVNEHANNNSIVKNKITAMADVILESNRNKVINNRLTALGDVGVDILGGHKNKVINNKQIACEGGATGVFIAAGSDKTKVIKNRFDGCDDDIVDNGDRSKIKLR